MYRVRQNTWIRRAPAVKIVTSEHLVLSNFYTSEH